MRHRNNLLFFLFFVALLLAPSASAYTLLTNGIPANFVLPLPRTTSTLYTGDLGYAIYAPPGATRLTIELDTDIPTYDADILVRFDANVGMSGLGLYQYDFRSSGGPGNKQVVITPQSAPPLQAGTYYIGFVVVSTDVNPTLTLTATVEGGSVPPVRTVAISTFDDNLDGWTTNSDAGGQPAGSLGAADSRALWQSSGGRPSGFAEFVEGLGSGLNAWVAPAKFLGNLASLTEPRFEFDFMQISGSEPVYAVEIRILGSGTAFVWQGSIPPAPIVHMDPCARLALNPATNNLECVLAVNTWVHYTAALVGSQWSRIDGDRSFAQVLANVERIEVITSLGLFASINGLDNFALRSRGTGPTPIVMAGNTSFVSGGDGWTRNYPASDIAGATSGNATSTLRWVPFDGNPGGYVRLTGAGAPNHDYLVAPAPFLGDYQNLPGGQLEFDYQHNSFNGATLPVEVRLLGAQSVFVWQGAVPPNNIWTHYIAPLKEPLWQRAAGTASFADVLANVQRIEVSAAQSNGPESDAVDNFWLLPGPITPAPPAITANPSALSFNAVVHSSNPAPQSINVTSIGGGAPVSFSVAASRASWLRVSAGSGLTPRSVNVWPDITGLSEGTYTGVVNVTATGLELTPQAVTVSLTVNARSGATPRLNFGGAVNAASNKTQLAPGALGSLYGIGLGPAAGVAAAFRPGTTVLPTRLQGVRLLVNETYGALIAEAPLLYASDGQINFQLPFEATGRAEVRLVVDNNGVLSDPLPVQVVPTSPGIFTYGANRAVAVNEDNSVNAADNGAWRGSVLTVYMTGQGTVTPSVPTGAAAPSRPLARVPFSAQAWIGGASAKLLFVGLTPGLVGVLQVNLVVPEAASSGDSPLVVNIGGWTSNSPIVTVR